LDNISFTDEQFSNAINELMTKGEVDMTKVDIDDPRIKLKVNIYDNVIQDLKITVYRNDISIGSVMYDQGYGLQKIVEANDGDTFKFVCTGATGNVERKLYLVYEISDNKTYEILISQINHTIPTNVNIYLNYEDGKLNLINLDYNIDTKYINELVAYNTSYLDYYKKLKHNSFLPNVIFISIGIIIFIGGSFCVYLLIKKVKKGSF
jgi:hypothetical protein